jgi:tetratricopeptide (TPR) repeat protein
VRIHGVTLAVLGLALGGAPQAQAKTADAPKARSGPSLKMEDLTAKICGQQTEQSIREEISNAEVILELEDKAGEEYPKMLVALADIYWDLAEVFECQTQSATLLGAISDAEDAKDAARLAKLQGELDRLRGEQASYQQKTIASYRMVVQKYPASPKLDEFRYYLGFHLISIGSGKEGVAELTTLITQHPTSSYLAAALVNIADYFFEANDYLEARARYDRVTAIPETPLAVYAVYKLGWCDYNQKLYEPALERFLEVIRRGEEAKAKRQPLKIDLTANAQADMIRPYAKVGKPKAALGFFQRYAPGSYLELTGDLAKLYAEELELDKSSVLLRSLVKEALTARPNGKNEAWRALGFQRLIVENTVKKEDKKGVAEELAELVDLYKKLKPEIPAKQASDEGAAIEEAVITRAVAYHELFEKTKAEVDLDAARELYVAYLEAFRDQPRAYDVRMNYGLTLLSKGQNERAAEEFERVIEMQPTGTHADEAAERAVVAYLEALQQRYRDQTVKNEAEEDTAEQPLDADAQAFVHAVDRWMKIAAKQPPDKAARENLPKARFLAAKVLYNFNRFQEAARRFLEFLEKHPGHELEATAALHVLSSYNLAHDVDSLSKQAEAFRIPKYAGTPVEEAVTRVRNELGFLDCFRFEKASEWTGAAKCFIDFSNEFPTAQKAPSAVYNAAVNYFRAKQVGQALATQNLLYERFRNDELAPKALYAIAEIFRETTVYDQAANQYERFVQNHGDHKLAEKALRYASIFRKTLGQYDIAVENLKLYLGNYAKESPEVAARVHLDILRIRERQRQVKAILKGVRNHLKLFPDGEPSSRLQVLALKGKALAMTGNLVDARKALEAFRLTLAAFQALSDEQRAKLSADAISAVAEAHFNLGDVVLTESKRIKLAGDEGQVQKAITAKLETMTLSKKEFEQVIGYGHPGWTIASHAKLCEAFREFADGIEESPVPVRLKAAFELEEAYRQKLTEVAGKVRDRALESCRTAQSIARETHWFNTYSEQAESIVAELDLTDHSVKEFRLRPDRIKPNSALPEFKTGAGVSEATLAILHDPKRLAAEAAQAEGDLVQAAGKPGADPAVWYNAGLLAWLRGDAKAARERWEKALSNAAGYAPAAARLAWLDLAGGQPEAVAQRLQQIVEADRQQPEARNLLSELAIAKNEHEPARQHGRNVLAGDPDNANALLNIALTYFRGGLIELAGLIAQNGLKRQPKAAALHNLMGLVHLARDDTKHGTDSFLAAVEADPNQVDALLNLAALELAYGDFNSALAHLDRAFTKADKDPLLLISHGAALRGAGKLEEAQKAYEAALAQKPDLDEALYNLCILHQQYTNRYQDALTACQAYSDRIGRKHPKVREMKQRLRSIKETLESVPAAPSGTPEPAPSSP